ncbi:MAG: hypothetical protein C0518_10965 [Opitutus sp.]|nr:hypothetical protein [Opitutus sp.]
MAQIPDVIVIGGGVAGLAAANVLAGQGVRVRLIEARGRLGGRIFSHDGPAWGAPMELGAEFIHGGNPEFDEFLTDAGLATRSAEGEMWLFEQGVLRRTPDFWERVARIAAQIPAAARGFSFADFLAAAKHDIPAEDQRLMTHFVEGFNAAPAGNLSAAVLRADHAGAEDPQKRLVKGYNCVVEALRRQLPAGQVEVVLHADVTEVRWEAGAAIVQVRSDGEDVAPLHEARAVIVTVPLGLLKAGALKFTPPLEAKDAAIQRAGWGDVVRFNLRFTPDIWRDEIVPAELRGENGATFAFLNAPGEKIPVWWAPAPRAPVLVGWVGGPAADRVMRESGNELLADAAETLGRIWKADPVEVRQRIVEWRWHNWRSDVFSRGAYSYAAAGAEDAAREIALPVAGTLFFAGEATAEPTELGTVHGAFASGLRAAEEVLSALGTTAGIVRGAPPSRRQSARGSGGSPQSG